MNSHKDTIGESVGQILETIPRYVQVIAAAKTRTLTEVQAVIEAGVKATE